MKWPLILLFSAALFAQDAQHFFYSKSFPGSTPAYVQVTLDKNGEAIYREAPDDDLLLVEWLNALIYEMATRDLLFGRFAVTLHDHVLDAKVWGQSLDRERHQPSVEVKAVTYTELSMAQREDGTWVAQCVVDV